MASLALHIGHKLLAGLLGTHSRQALQLQPLLGNELVHLRFPLFKPLSLYTKTFFPLAQVCVALIQLGQFAIEILFSLQQALLLGLQLAAHLLGLIFPLGLGF